MTILAKISIGFVAFIHFYIFLFEAFAWEKRGPKVFKSFPKDLFPKTKAMAQNQGLYNLFLAIGLLWSFFIQDVTWAKNIALFFLTCVALAGIVGALTAEKKIFFVQTVPALIGLILLFV